MVHRYRKPILAVLLTSLMIVSPLATIPVAAEIDADATSSTVEVKDDPQIDAWEFSGELLRTDNTGDTTVDIPNTRKAINESSGNEQTIRQGEGDRDVYTTDDEVDFRLLEESGGFADVADLNLSRSTTQVHIARLEENVDEENTDRTSMPGTTGELQDRLTEDNVNSNASFKNITQSVLDDNPNLDFPLEFSHEFNNSGMYAVMVTRHENGETGVTLADEDEDGYGNITVESPILIGAVESVAVQQTKATVTAPSDAAPGDTLEFDVDANLDSESVNHSIAVYHEDTFTSSETTIRYPGTNNINNSTVGSDFNYTWTIGSVNGVSNVKDDVTVLGRTLGSDSNANQRGATDVVDIVDEIADLGNTSEPESDTGSDVLDASVTTKIDGNDTTVSVETYGNWTEGDYQYIYMASSGTDSTEFSTAADPLTIKEDGDNGGDNLGGGGGGGGGAPAGDESEGPPSIDQIRSTLNLVTPDSDTTIDIVDDDPDTPGVSVTPEGTGVVRRINFNDEGTTGSVNIREYNNPPETVARQVADSVSADLSESTGQEVSSDSIDTIFVGDITPTSNEVEDTSAAVEFAVDADRVDNPAQLTVVKETYDFEAQQTRWQQQETSVVETTDEEVTVEANIDSFSLFAVAEIQDSGQGQIDEEPADDQEQEEEDDGPGTTAIIGIVIVLALVAVAVFVYRQQQSGDGGL